MRNHHPATPHPLPAFTWDETLSTGIEEVDSQHQLLFQLTEQIRTLHNTQATVEQVSLLLSELDQYTIYHFETEEMLMERYPISDGHKNAHLRAHESFVMHIKRAAKLSTFSPNAAIDFLLAFLTQWLLHHIANMDMLLVEEINTLQLGINPLKSMSPSDRFRQTLVEKINTVYSDFGDRAFQIMELNLQLQSEIERRKEVERELTESRTRFRMMADHTHSWEYWLSPDNQVMYMSPSCLRITGYAPEDFSSDPDLLYRIIHPDDRALMDDYVMNSSMQEEDDDEIGIRIMHRDGGMRWIVHSCKYLYSPDADFLGQRVSNRDITDRHLQNDSMLLVTNVFESINEAAMVTDQNNRIIVVNSAFSNITGYEPEEVIGKHPGILAAKSLSLEQTSEWLRKLTAKGRWQGEIDYRRKSGTLYTAAVSIDSMRDRHGNISNYIIVFSDISERKESEQRIHYLSHHDQLTGLPNWKLFTERAQNALDAAKQKRRRFALMYVDIDHFKQTKDRLGHEMSDLLLKIFAERLRARMKASYTAARIGSDEFVVLLPDPDTEQSPAAAASEIMGAFTEPFQIHNTPVSISASIGIALYPEHGLNVSHLMKCADLAVFQAKRSGGSTVRVYNPTHPSETVAS